MISILVLVLLTILVSVVSYEMYKISDKDIHSDEKQVTYHELSELVNSATQSTEDTNNRQ